MRRMVFAGFMVFAVLAGGAMAQQQPAENSMNVPQGETIVWHVQIELARAGLYEGRYDGIVTAQTQEAIEEFEHRIGWPESGRATPDLVIALRRYNLVVIAEGEDF